MTDAEREILTEAIDTAVKANRRYIIATAWSVFLSVMLLISSVLLFTR